MLSCSIFPHPKVSCLFSPFKCKLIKQLFGGRKHCTSHCTKSICKQYSAVAFTVLYFVDSMGPRDIDLIRIYYISLCKTEKYIYFCVCIVVAIVLLKSLKCSRSGELRFSCLLLIILIVSHHCAKFCSICFEVLVDRIAIDLTNDGTAT